MSKGSLFFGNASGKLGQVVLSTLKGQQIARAYQPKVANPQTATQTNQRAKFANAVKFFRQARKNLFLFAYEDKKPRESYYNAFMRHNITYSVTLPRVSYDDPRFPALGNQFVLSDGSLAEMKPSVTNGGGSNHPIFSLPFNQIKGSGKGVGDLSKALAGSYGAVDGDYLTMVLISASGMSPSSYVSHGPLKWDIYQLIVDSTSSDTLEAALSVQDGKFKPVLVDTSGSDISLSFEPTDDYSMAAFILSRKTADGKLLVTKSVLVNSPKLDTYINNARYNDAKMSLLSWGKADTPVLKGGIVEDI